MRCHHMYREFPGATQFYKGGTPKAPPVPLPPAPTTAAENASRNYRSRQVKRAMGFSSTILTGGMQGESQVPGLGKTLLGG